MINVQLKKGIYLPSAALWLDPKKTVPLGVVTHAHSDHAGWHRETIATPATIALMKARKTAPSRTIIHELPYFTPWERSHARITLIPAGHVLGSAQVLVETEEGSLLYTGDFKRRESLTCEEATTRKAETLIIESTFGLPRYSFPPSEQTHQRIIDFCHRTLESQENPVLLAYSLGKAQELMAILSQAGINPVIHESVAKISAVYEEHGIDLGSYTVWDKVNHEKKVLILPPNVRSSLSSLKKIRSAIISGWAVNEGAIYRYQCDEAFPLSDHADHGELIEHVEEVEAQKIYTVHGYTEEFARDLRYLGIDALALGGVNQLELLL
ncbi:MAG: MBL fold metallo-hydrolase [Chthoniobacterales bacterium]|nr:MBL fold metallo-hydrolase [Chthoniobacterales bacterium]